MKYFFPNAYLIYQTIIILGHVCSTKTNTKYSWIKEIICSTGKTDENRKSKNFWNFSLQKQIETGKMCFFLIKNSADLSRFYQI